MKFVLIGFMGSGKTTVARELGLLTSLSVIETDDEIIDSAPVDTIPALFELEGEAGFRKRETEVLSHALKKNDVIISTGGGVVECPENQQQLSSSDAVVVHLESSFAAIVDRIGDPGSRPLFQDQNEAKSRYEKRQPLYQSLATLFVSVDDFTPREVAEIILAALGKTSKWSVFCVIGDPVGHSVSPQIHSAALKSLAASHKAFVGRRVQELHEFMSEFRSNSALQGLAVTIPHKELICEMLDELSSDSLKLGAVNTVVKESGKLLGYNTDYIGIEKPLSARIDLSGKKVAVIGAGGTARAALYATQKLGGKATVINRSAERGTLLATEWNVPFHSLQNTTSLHEYDVVIHTTSVGLQGEPSLFPPEAFRPGMLVMDVIYSPRMTPFLKAASAGGAEYITGDEMFLAQAEEQFRIHHGSPAPLGVMKERLDLIL